MTDPDRDGLKLITCPAVLGELAEDATLGVDSHRLEAQLHLSPERLKAALQAAVAEADYPGATIVLSYGLCSNSALGLKTEQATLVVPRVDDCVAMMLGSNEVCAAENANERGSYDMAKAYLQECDTIVSEHEKLVQKGGAERAGKTMQLLLKHDMRIVLVDTGRYDLKPCRARAADFAELFAGGAGGSGGGGPEGPAVVAPEAWGQARSASVTRRRRT